MDGVVKWFSEEKGYGFITDKNNKDYYFHVSDVKGALLPEKGCNIHFDVEKTSKGYRAKNISLTKSNDSTNNRLDFCKNCNKKIVPRMITYRGEPQKTVCPYCATVIKNFEENILVELMKGISIFLLSLVTIFFELLKWGFNIIFNNSKRR
ncbi:cold shock domain-containing protein [Salmonella enterica subsp. enterica]|uniref:Cold shock domain-containing protein n=1 Tax=Salmonella enteritidis TaxID=149539 RepID=A0A5V0B8I6_SALEN|nr:cold shock domain-containing protein [Salmonella enterica]EBS5458857.1 cold shock domain-containing protein [Salmonella enterica subsp. enterica serovar Enteritidis]ECG1480683.1 cold shock domain-containing protein [Salmonella enterica subsp. enterica]EDH9166013.1 cold shock domain-containing protein [Salmonella enterica subsp. enterica serovar Fallowfield]EDQ7128173.1 cold shock domain-containing protein [Salmonella enterica subsp. enterica serovar Fischerhuette]EEC6742580.1 cold shock dom